MPQRSAGVSIRTGVRRWGHLLVGGLALGSCRTPDGRLVDLCAP